MTTTTAPTLMATESARLCADDVWRAIEHASFAVLGHVTPAGEPRSTGVVYAAAGRRIYVAVAPGSWKARQIADGDPVSLTVLIRRGGLLSLLFPIPPATISLRARAVVHAPGSLDLDAISPSLARLVPTSRRETACVLELEPQGQFLTYGLGVPLKDLADPARAMTRVPVA
jgi:Pyridoxamine 5'-phosphate oxidase